MNLNDIKYGTVPIFHIDSISSGSAIINKAIDAGIVDELLNNPPPPNDSEETQNELKYLLGLTTNAAEYDYSFCKVLEEKHYDFIARVCQSLNLVETEDSIKEFANEYDGLVNYIKLKVNRPRPHQLAIYYDIPLFPIVSTNANSPSWPSGHSVDFLVIIHKLKAKYPDLKDEFDSLYQKIKNVRELSGVHYPTDGQGAELLYTLLVKNDLI